MQDFNFHTHTFRCGHADLIEDEEYIKEYIKMGFKKIAFTDHCPEKTIIDTRDNVRMSYNEKDEYLTNIQKLKEKYANQIIIESGFEVEHLPGEEENLKELKKETDKLILGQHFIYDKNGNLKFFRNRSNFDREELLTYVNYIEESIKLGIPDIIAHPDVYMLGKDIFGENESEVAHKICQIAEKYNIPLEINLAKIFNDTYYKDKVLNNDSIEKQKERLTDIKYPCREFWEIASNYNIKVLYGIDVHHKGQIRLFNNLVILANEIIGENTINKLKFISNEDILVDSVPFFKECTSITQDLRGHSTALRYICEKEEKTYFTKIYKNNRIEDLDYIEDIYNKLEIPTAKIIEKGYLEVYDKTFAIYEYIDGKTLKELTKELDLEELEIIGKRVGNYLSKFKNISGNKEEIIKKCDKEFERLIKDLYTTKNNKTIDIDRVVRNFNELKVYVYKTNPSFIHKDINLNNVIVHNGEPYFIDTDGGKVSFRTLDFRGICWWTWDGDNKLNEQAIYRGIFKGLFNDDIPEDFHKEIAFTIYYEFLLKVNEAINNKDNKRMDFIFDKFGKIFDRSNYFEDYIFDWFN